MEEKNFNFKEFILKEEIVEETEEKKSTARQKPTVEFNVEWADHCDAIISRKTKTSTQYLALLVSQKQYYIKDNSGKVSTLTTDNLNKFMNGSDDNGILINTNWMTLLPKNKKNNGNLLNILNSDLFCELAKMGYAWLGDSLIQQKEDWRNRRVDNEKLVNTTKLFMENKKLFRKLIETGKQIPVGAEQMFKKELTNAFFEDTSNSLATFFGDAYGTILMNVLNLRNRNVLAPSFVYFKDVYGESGVSQLADAMAAQRCVSSRKLRSFDTVGYWRRRNTDEAAINLAKIAKHYNCKFENFLDYVVYEPQRQGYTIEDFAQTWYDTLRMQVSVYGEVKDKYPEELASLHQRMSYRCSLLEYAKELEEQQERNNAITYRKKELSGNCYADKNEPWIITIPSSVGDILEEAQQQSNCLASYVEPYVKGDTDLYFMREKNEPEKSLITIEIRDNALRQAYAHHNTKPGAKEMRFIEKWCKKNGFTYATDYSPRGV